MLSADSGELDWAVVVAVVAVREVQVAVDQVAGVIAVGHGLVAAAGAVDVTGFVAAALVVGRAGGGVRLGDLDAVLVHVTLMGVVEVTVVQIVHVPVMLDGGVAAAFAVDVIVVGVLRAAHCSSFSLGRAGQTVKQFIELSLSEVAYNG